MNLNDFLQAMAKKGISDIHFKVDSVPYVRYNGKMIAPISDKFSATDIEELAFSIMTPKQKKQFEAESELDIAYSIKDRARFRMNVYRQRGTIALTVRVVPLRAQTFEELNLPSEPLRKLSSESRGLILVAGITGAGKTTTMNSMLDYINNNFDYKIITVEDPIEYYHDDKKSSISQREVGEDTKSCSNALRYILRQDPDVIVIGEMRDFETINSAITAAETGHLVLSTIHTMDAVQTIDRIIDLYPPHRQDSVRSQLSNVLKGIWAQRLVLRKDGEECLPITEVLMVTSLVRKLILENKLFEVYKTIKQGAYYGMHTFDQCILNIYKEGKISLEEAIDKASNPDDLLLKLKGIERGD